MTHISFQAANTFSLTWGLGAAVVLFLIAVAYALWPKNKSKFDHAARTPLQKDDADG